MSRRRTCVQLALTSCMPAAHCRSCANLRISPNACVQEKVERDPAPPTAALADALDHTVLLAQQAGQVQRGCGLDILPDDFVRFTLKFGLTEVTPVANASQ